MHSNVATLRKASIWNEASRIIHEEGFRAFWKGNLVTIAHRLPYSSVNFYAYEHYKKVIAILIQIFIFIRLCYRESCIYKYSCSKIASILSVQLLKTVPGLQNHRENVSADLCVQFVGGGLAGITASTSTYPLDLVRTRLAAQVRLNVLDFRLI